MPREHVITNRAVKQYHAADPAVRQAGMRWYSLAERQMRDIAREGPVGFGSNRAAAVFAALSPRTQWAVNLRGAYSFAKFAQLGLPEPPPMGLFHSRAKAWAIAQLEVHPSRVLAGPKVTRFWKNLSGDPDPVTVDIWMARAVGVDEDKISRDYSMIERAYQKAAETLSIEPRQLQAIVWLHVRGWKPGDPAGYAT